MNLIIETDRLFLKPLTISDQDSMVNVIMSDKEVMKWLPSSDCVSTKEEQNKTALNYLEEFTEPWSRYGFGVWGIFYKSHDSESLLKFIGYCGFLAEQISGAGPEIAYALKREMWGKGLVPEAVSVCLDWLFKNHNFLSAHAVTEKNNLEESWKK